MKKFLTIYVLLFAFANISCDVTIFSAIQDQCSPLGEGILSLTLESNSPITTPMNFKITLKGSSDIEAVCEMEGFPSDLIHGPSDTIIVDSSKEVPKTGIDESDMINLSSDNEIFDSNLENSDGIQKGSDEPSSDKLNPSDDLGKTETPGSEEPKPVNDSDEGLTNSDQSDNDNAESPTEQNSEFVSDSPEEDGEDATNEEKFDSTDAPEGGRRLQDMKGESYAYEVICTFDTLKYAEMFTIEPNSDSGITTTEEKPEVYVEPCLTLDDAKNRKGISLSFRQVNTFSLKLFSFMFYAFTSKPIPVGYSFIFYFYFMSGFDIIPKRVPATCSIEKEVSEIDEKKGLAPASFTCKFEKDQVPSGATSLQVIASDDVAGLPTNTTLLNPKFTDEAIEMGLPNAADLTYIPSIINMEDYKPIFNEEEGTFTLKFPFEEGEIKKIIGKTFEFPLAFPSGVTITGMIKEFIGGFLSIIFAIDGKIEAQPLIWEQTVITIGGVEWFVLPGFESEVITTEGFNGTLSMDDIMNSDQELEGNSDDASSDEQQGQSGEISSDEGQNDEVDSDQESASSDEELSSEDVINGTSSGISVEEALEKAKIFISFRQLNGFINTGTIITFNFLALTTQPIEAGNIVILFVNLIGPEGTNPDTTEVTCTLPDAVTLASGQVSVQAAYKCTISGIDNIGQYTSLRLNRSDDITGIPEDETLLNPVLTDQAIKNGEIKNCTADASVPPTFVNPTIEQANCLTDGKFIIKGSLSEEKSIAAKFTIPLTYPEGTSITCTYEEESINCIADNTLEGTIVIEQTIITSGAEELFILSNVTAEEMDCGNGLHIKAMEKKDVSISFRQVSHIEKISGTFYFFFAAFVNENLQTPYTIDMNIILNNGEETKEKVATCTLNESVTTPSGETIQGDFNCSCALKSGEDFEPEELTVSTNNDKIGGCAELTKEEASPSATDLAIKDSENAESELGLTIDYYIEENKNIKPPSLKLSKFDLTPCEGRGKMKITGQFSQDIEEEMTFELPFSFPSSQVKCTVESATQGEDVEISCKIQKTKKYGSFRSFVVEPRLLKKKRKEMLFIEKISDDLSKDYYCQNFNEIKLQRARARKSAPFSFLQLGRPSGYARFFFMALMKKNTEVAFATRTITFTIIHIKTSRMRLLDETAETPLSLDCSLGNKLDNDNAAVLDCGTGKEGLTPVKVDSNDPNIAGLPEDAPVQTKLNPDYSQIDNLKLVDNLPTVTINDLTSNNCSLNGSYNIYATSDKDLDFTTKGNITIPFATPDSSGLCIINVKSDKKTLIINCENTDAFSASEMIIESQVIYDEDDATPLFKLTDDYTAPVQFACVISDKSLKVPFSNSTSPETPESSDTSGNKNKYFRNGSSSGLSGGAIAGIIIGIVAVVAIVGVVIALAKKGVFSGAAASSKVPIESNSTLNRFGVNNQNANVV